MKLTRRNLLAGIGGGSLVLGGWALRSRPPTFSKYTFAAPTEDTNDAILRIAWYETVNGAFVENHAGTSDDEQSTLDPETEPAYLEEATQAIDARGPVVALGNVLPGDRGTLVVGLEVVAESLAEPVDVWLKGSITETAENGINQPEANAGDTTLDRGELADQTLVEAWIDNSPVGACDGLRTLDESLRSPIVERAPFSEAFSPDSAVGSSTGVPAFGSCLDPGTLRCVALSWEIPETVTDQIQGDSFAFDFAFAAGPCGGESPFAVGDAQ